MKITDLSDQKAIYEHLKYQKILIINLDTIYGFVWPIKDQKSTQKIIQLKKRTKPFIMCINNLKKLNQQFIINEIEKKIISQFWPGPLTIILKERNSDNHLAVRYPKSGINDFLVKSFGNLFSTSCNLKNKKELNDWKNIQINFAYLNNDYMLVKSNLDTQNIFSSTIIQIIDHKVKILREGVVQKNKLFSNL